MFNRAIFGPIFNGQEQVFVDPLKVYRRLVYLTEGKGEELIKAAKSLDLAVSFPAKEKLIEATTQAFELAPFDPQTGLGMQEEDVWAILNAFLDWVAKKKVSGENSPSLSPPTDGSPASNPYPTIRLSADCG